MYFASGIQTVKRPASAYRYSPASTKTRRAGALSGRDRHSYWKEAVTRYLSTALRVALVGALLAVMVAAAIQLFAGRREPQSEPKPPPMTRAPYPPAMGEFPGSRPSSLPVAAAPSLTVYEEMARDFESSRDLRDFVERARKRPNAGGTSYALAAIGYCNSWEGIRDERERLRQEATGSTVPKVEERLLAVSIATGRCDGFKPDEISLEAMYSVYASPAAKHDPIISIQGRLKSARTEQERTEVAREILQMRDPLLLASAGRMFSQGTAESLPHVDGRRWGGVSQVAYLNAWLLVPCSFGAACDHADIEVAMACARYGHCYPDRRELIRARLSPQDHADALRLHARLVEIVTTADADALRPPRS